MSGKLSSFGWRFLFIVVLVCNILFVGDALAINETSVENESPSEKDVDSEQDENLFEMSRYSVPIIICVIGEGASGGALGIGVGDKVLMMENAWYSVISPEGCAAILWRDAAKASEAAEAMKVTAEDLLSLNIIDKIIPEPNGGAHRDPKQAAENVKKEICQSLKELMAIPTDDLLKMRVEKFAKMGAWEE